MLRRKAWFGILLLLLVGGCHRESGFVPPPRVRDLANPAFSRARVGGTVGTDGAFRAWKIGVGDLNADGIDDVAIGLSGADYNGRPDAGSVAVIFGRTTWVPPQEIDLARLSAFDVRFDGAMPGDRVGRTEVEITDVTGDGVADLLFAAWSADTNGVDSGSIYLIRGGPDFACRGPKVRDLIQTKNYDTRFDGPAGARLGAMAVAAGDVNGDGQPDLLMGGRQFNSGLGAVWVVFGPVTATGAVPLDVPTNFNVRYDGTGWLGNAIAVGDVNGDGFHDVILGARNADFNARTDSGSVYVVYGGPGLGTGVRDLAVATNWNLRFDGAAAGDEFGVGTTARDVTGDGIADLVLGAYRFDKSPAAVDSGAVYVIYGSTAFPATTGNVFDVAVGANFNVRFDGAAGGDNLGVWPIAGDLNGDAIADLVLDARLTDFNTRADSGSDYVRLGGTLPGGAGNVIDLSAPTTFHRRFDGAAAFDFLAQWENAHAIGDLNGDGLGDLVVAAPGADAMGRPDAGSVYVIFGPLVATGTVDLAIPTNFSIRFDGPANGNTLFVRFSQVGDFNGDGIADLAVTSPAADFNGRPDSGSVYVVLGPLAGDVDLAQSFHWRFDGPPNADLYTIASGDVNGDGKDDLAIGYKSADFNGRQDSGSVYVIFGGRPPGIYDLMLASSYDWRFDGAAAGDGFGWGLWVGRADGDAIADILAGALRADPLGRVDAGSLYVIPGSSTRAPGNYDMAVASNFAYRFDGAAAGDGVGYVPAAGDFNGNGLPDLKIPALYTDFNGRPNSGSVYVVYDLATKATGAYDLALTSSYNVRFDGALAGQTMDHHSEVEDLDGDGADDLVFGTFSAGFNARPGSGSVYVRYGGGTIPDGNYDLADPASFDARFDGPQAGAGVAFVSSADLDGDGRRDLVVCGSGVDPGGKPAAGAAYVIFGRPKRFSGVFDLAADDSWDLRFDGAAPGDRLSISARFGDVTGDGRADLLLTGTEADLFVSDGGVVYVIAGPIR